MQQQKFAYNVKVINFMRILSGAGNSVNNRNLIANLPVRRTGWWALLIKASQMVKNSCESSAKVHL